MFSTIAKNIFSNYVGMAGAIVIAFMLSPFLVHTLGDTKYGVWSIVSALTGYMALLDLGISSAIARYVSKYKASNDYKSINTVIGSGLSLMLIIGVVLILVSPLLATAVVSFFKFEGELGQQVYWLIIISSVDIAIFVATAILVGSFLGFQRYEVINGVNLTISLMNALLFYLVLGKGYDILAMGVIVLFSKVVAAIIFYITLKKQEKKVVVNPAKTEIHAVKTIFSYSRYTFLTMLAMQLVYYSDAFVIGYFMSAAAITYYTIPWSLSEYSNKLIHAIANTFVPVFSEQESTKNFESIYSTYITGTKFIMIISNLLCVGVLAVGDYFIALWMGQKYAIACSALLTIMFVTQLIKGPQLLSYSILLGTSNHRKFSYYNFAFSILNLILSILFIQRFGLIGVAVATAITQIAFYAVLTPILTSRVLNSSLWNYFRDTHLFIIPSSIILFVVLKALAHRTPPESYFLLLSQALIAAVFYLISVYWIYLDSQERAFLREKSMSLVNRFRHSAAQS